MKTPSLIDILKEPTEIKQEKASFFVDEVLNEEIKEKNIFSIPTPEPKPNEAHFEPPQETIKEKKDTVRVDKLSYSENLNSAKSICAIYDIFQTFTFPYGYKRAMFTKEEWKIAQNLKIKLRQNEETSLSEKELIILEKLDTFNDLRESIPFTDAEIDAITKPLAQVLGKYNIKLGAELVLISALGMAALPRIMPFFTPLEKL